MQKDGRHLRVFFFRRVTENTEITQVTGTKVICLVDVCPHYSYFSKIESSISVSGITDRLIQSVVVRESLSVRDPAAKARSEEMTSALLSFLRRRCSSEPRPVFSPVLSPGSSLCNNNQNKGVINTFNYDRIINNLLVVLWCWKL